MSTTSFEFIWLKYLLNDLDLSRLEPVQLQCDNKAALYIVANAEFHEGTKHIELDCLTCQKKYSESFISTTYGTSQD